MKKLWRIYREGKDDPEAAIRRLRYAAQYGTPLEVMFAEALILDLIGTLGEKVGALFKWYNTTRLNPPKSDEDWSRVVEEASVFAGDKDTGWLILPLLDRMEKEGRKA